MEMRSQPNFAGSADEDAKRQFMDVLEELQDELKSEVYNQMIGHFDTVEGTNRGNTSSVRCKAKKGPEAGKAKIKMVNNHQQRIVRHELGHALMDSFGFDGTQEGTNRANNKSNYSRWPSFSFGKKDSPVERFLFRRYGDLDEITTHKVEEDDLEELAERSDLFVHKDKYYEADTYGYSHGHRERQRHKSPVVDHGEGAFRLNIRPLIGHSKVTVDNRTAGAAFADIEIVDRYELTPGLATILGEEEKEPDWEDPMHKLLYQINTHWYEAITLVRCRGDKRERGQMKSPRGDAKSYYVMNTHEFFAETFAMMLGNRSRDINDEDRMRETCPGLLEAFEEALLE